ncbi:MAG TPA: biotin--[acetyl-CoA-carboxylase] ligase, partial [Polyangia bacterium]|nr:biotin--[acetyl-CoA-carboxylase] ligase [Polyangia bacterium]
MGRSAFDPDLFRELLAGPAGDEARPVLAFETVDSTSTELARRLRGGAPAGTVVVAGSQTAGRGRIGRPWCSPPGGNLYLPVAVTVPPPEADHLTAVPLAAGVAAADALVAAGLAEISLKWPNDLLAEGRKIGGVLCESTDPRARPLLVAVGIGANLSPAPLDPVLARGAATVPEVIGSALPAEPVAAAFVSGLERRLAGLVGHGRAGLVADWKVRAEPFGRRV